ncbi:hypothetical protein M0805_003752 [Coniferiporia weirii]|nr:hypothetical protein M0805_003752 [Coniferiporia weirii]
MSGGIFSIKLDEYTPAPSPGPSPPASAAQARKSDRACDFCRRRKTRCDGAQTNSSKCTNCRRNQCPCTYLEASRPRGPSKAYVTALEDRIERFERLFKRLRPEADFTNILGPPVPRGSWKDENDSKVPGSSKSAGATPSSRSASISQSIRVPPHTSMLPPTALEESHSDSDSYEEDFADRPRNRLPAWRTSHSRENPTEYFPVLGSFGTNEEGSSVRFHGKSSFFPLVRTTRHYMRATAGHDGFHDVRGDGDAPLSDACRIGICKIPQRRRDIYWTLLPWEEAWERKHAAFTASSPSPSPSSSSASSQERLRPLHEFPQSDLTLPLLSLYFHHTNSIFPLLHAPTFYAQFRDRLHLRDAQFAGVVWCLMAIGSRWSQDRRVLWDGWGSESGAAWQSETEDASDEDLEWASAGWRFFLRSLDGPSFTVTSLDPPSLFDLQFCSLGAMFLRGSSIHPAGWVVIGTGLRKAMDVGAHRKKVYSPKPSIENELWKRAFWMLILFDRMGSAGLGRPCCVRDEDIDLDFPLEVDDEYWIPNDPSWPAFKQPSDKPSIVSGFVSFLKLSQIMGHTMRTIYCIDKSKVLLGLVSDGWQEQIVSQLNTALDEWVESVPEHLRWSSGIEHDIFANQSATIYTSYYLALILIYRPFSQASVYLPQQDIPAKPKALFPFPADSICSNSAHAAIRIIEVQMRRGLSNIPNMIAVSQVCAATLLMGLHASQATHEGDLETKKGESERVMQDVEKCIRCLELAESRWIMARKFL